MCKCACVCVCACVCACTHILPYGSTVVESLHVRDLYGMATISRLLKTIGHFCKRALYKRLYFAKKTYNSKEPTNRSHPIIHMSVSVCIYIYVCVCICVCLCIIIYGMVQEV